MNEPQRFSGPDLSDVLRRVRDELGEDAVIEQANKVRSGGVAGFFANEHFEVLAKARERSADPAWSIPPAAVSVATPSAAPALDLTSVATAVDEPAMATSARSTQDALLERADRISTLERIEQLRQSEPAELGGDGFATILDHLLDDPSIPTEAREPLFAGAARSASTSPGPAAPAPSSGSAASASPVGAGSAPAERSVIDVRDGRPVDRPSLWNRLAVARQWRSPALDAAGIRWFVGPRKTVEPIEARFGAVVEHDVVHLSDFAHDLPGWSSCSTLPEARARGRRWAELGVAGSIIWDRPVAELEPHELAAIGPDEADLISLVTSDLSDLDGLERLRELAQVPVVIELDTPPPSAEIAAALERGLPIVSVLGMRMTPQLIVAIQLDADG